MKKHLTILLSTLLFFLSCEPEWYPPSPGTRTDRPHREGVDGVGYKKVLVLYLEGFNNLSDDIFENIEQLGHGFLPRKEDKLALLVYSHNTKNRGDYQTKTEPVICQAFQKNGTLTLDTLKTWPKDKPSVTAEMVRDVLTFVKKEFPSASYGLLYSSHATGWIPSDYNTSDDSALLSIGSEFGDKGSSQNRTMNVEDLAEALPMDLEYIIFDCCLMGGIESIYPFKDKVRNIIASPTEILSYGFDYTTLTSRLLMQDTIELEKVCDDYYTKYENGSSPYATVAIYDCSTLKKLAFVCSSIFENHKGNAFEIKETDIQNYNYTFQYHYDLKDIIRLMGADETELKSLDSALSETVIYKKATPYFINTRIDPEKFSGLSMYLPRTWRTKLNELYKNTEWNMDTDFIN